MMLGTGTMYCEAQVLRRHNRSFWSSLNSIPSHLAIWFWSSKYVCFHLQYHWRSRHSLNGKIRSNPNKHTTSSIMKRRTSQRANTICFATPSKSVFSPFFIKSGNVVICHLWKTEMPFTKPHGGIRNILSILCILPSHFDGIEIWIRQHFFVDGEVLIKAGGVFGIQAWTRWWYGTETYGDEVFVSVVRCFVVVVDVVDASVDFGAVVIFVVLGGAVITGENF